MVQIWGKSVTLWALCGHDIETKFKKKYFEPFLNPGIWWILISMAGDEKVGRWDWFVKISECCTTDILSFVVFNHDGTFFDYVTCFDYITI